MTGQEHSTDSGKEAQTHFICIVPPIPFDIALLVHPLCNCLCMNFKLTHCSNSRNHNSYGNMKSRNKNNKFLALSWHIDNKLIIPCFLRPHHSYAPFSQCTLECVENELGFSYPVFFQIREMLDLCMQILIVLLKSQMFFEVV